MKSSLMVLNGDSADKVAGNLRVAKLKPKKRS